MMVSYSTLVPRTINHAAMPGMGMVMHFAAVR